MQLDVDNVWRPVQVARYCGVHIQTVQYWRDNNRGPEFFKVGRDVFYRVEAVKQFQRERCARSRK